MNLKFQQIKLSALKQSPENRGRDIDGIGKDGIRELAASIESFGIIQPLAVRKSGTGFEIIAGHRRALAAAAAGLDSVPCVIRDDKGSIALQQIVENNQREDLSVRAMAQCVVQVMTDKKAKQGAIAKQIGRSEGYVSKLVTIAKAFKEYPNTMATLPDQLETLYKEASALTATKKVSTPKASSLKTTQKKTESGAIVTTHKIPAINVDKTPLSTSVKVEKQGALDLDEEKPENEILAEIRYAAGEAFPEHDHRIVPYGDKGFDLTFFFNSEAELREFIAVETAAK